MKFGELAQ